ncbi:MAG: tetratricopeptide repeat protein [Thermodesulfobacteriota bacterium]
MIRLLWVILIGTGIMLGGCAEKKAKELFETAQLEERQNNSEHARRLYQEIIEEYPDSDYAEPARERISVLAD